MAVVDHGAARQYVAPKQAVDAAEAKKVMQQAIALDGQESAALLVHYGDILHAMGEQFVAEIYWRKGLEKGYDADQITRRMEQGKAEKE